MKKVAVFFGGTSVEKEISVITGVLTLNAIDKTVYTPVPVYVSANGEFFTGEQLFDVEFYKNFSEKKLIKVAFLPGKNQLFAVKKKKIKPLFSLACVLNCMHGEGGEDGVVSAICKLHNIACASPNLSFSAISIDKYLSKLTLKGLKVNVVKGEIVGFSDDFNKKVAGLKYPLIVKPNRLGSSIGISVAKDGIQLKKALDLAFRFGEQALVEECLTDFIEINCAVYENSKGETVVSECERPKGKGSLLTFNDKYVLGEREFPAKIDAKLSSEIKRVSEKVYRTLGANGVIRIDYLVKNDKVYLNEINSVPGCLAYYLFSPTVKGFSCVIKEQIENALKRFAKSQTFVTGYASSVLNLNGAKSAKRK